MNETMVEELREIYESLTDMARPSNTLLSATEVSTSNRGVASKSGQALFS